MVGGKLSRCVAVMGPKGHLDWGEKRIQNFILLLYTWVSINGVFVKFVLKPCHWICMIWIWCVTTKIAQFIFHPTTSWAPSCYPESPNRTHHKIYKTNYKFSKILLIAINLTLMIPIGLFCFKRLKSIYSDIYSRVLSSTRPYQAL